MGSFCAIDLGRSCHVLTEYEGSWKSSGLSSSLEILGYIRLIWCIFGGMISITHVTVLVSEIHEPTAWSRLEWMPREPGRRAIKHQWFTPCTSPTWSTWLQYPGINWHPPFFITPIIFWLGSPRFIYKSFLFFVSRKPFPWIFVLLEVFPPPPTWASRLQPGRPFPNCEAIDPTVYRCLGMKTWWTCYIVYTCHPHVHPFMICCFVWKNCRNFDYNGHLKNKRNNYHHICINSESYRLSVCISNDTLQCMLYMIICLWCVTFLNISPNIIGQIHCSLLFESLVFFAGFFLRNEGVHLRHDPPCWMWSFTGLWLNVDSPDALEVRCLHTIAHSSHSLRYIYTGWWFQAIWKQMFETTT